jgi:predicted DNA-binding protein with PD1-like motif
MIVQRLLPGDDLKKSLEEIRDLNGLKSGFVLSMVGSLDRAILRLSNGKNKIICGPLEIVSSEGTISVNGIYVHWQFQMIREQFLVDICSKVAKYKPHVK